MGHGIKSDLDEPAHHIRDQRIGALLDYLLNPDPRLLGEKDRGEIVDSAGAGRRDLIRLLGRASLMRSVRRRCKSAGSR